MPAPSHLTEEQWLRDVHQPNVPQLTLRAIVGGALIGAVMCLSNLYVFFKAGWSMGVTITAGILAFALFKGLAALRLGRPLTLLENNALTTVASGAGYMTGGGNMAAWGALVMVIAAGSGALSGSEAGGAAGDAVLTIPATLPMILWFALIAALGVFCAIPIKRQLINLEALAFPTGTATAETLQTIHGSGGAEGSVKAKALMWGSLFAAVLGWCREAKPAWMQSFNIPPKIALGFDIAGRKAADWTLNLKTEVVLIGAGALMSFRTAWSLLLGSILTYGVLAPAMVADGVITTVDYKSIAGWTVWPGASLLVAAGITSFLLDWKSVKRSFGGIGSAFGGRKGPAEPIDAVECPAWWFPAGFLLLGPFVVILMAQLFAIPWWACVVAVPLAIVMGFIAARVTGDTDVTPTKALGPVTQIVYGALSPDNLSGNIMSANVTAGIGLHAADLLTTQKTGWLLGGSPRVQFLAQLIGVAVGAVLIVPAFNMLIPDPTLLGGEDWPAPSCVVWKGVSEAFSAGVSALHSTSKIAIAIGLALGVALALLEKFAPKFLKPFVPSPSGLGIAMVIPGANGIAMFLGGLLAEIARRKFPKAGEPRVVPIASGLIAGESLMGVLTTVLKVKGWLPM
ncbi:MAG: OPT family oligopeptide transporter [Planctomycetes bacterium]|nr:OPT family oligopeptide transporter [Planctomycetota bacterium]